MNAHAQDEACGELTQRLQTVPAECGESIIWLLFFSVNKQSKAPLRRELKLYLFWRWILSSCHQQRVWAFLWEVVFARVKRKRVQHHSRSLSHVSEVSEKLAVAKLKYKHQTASFAASLFGNNSKCSSQSSRDTLLERCRCQFPKSQKHKSNQWIQQILVLPNQRTFFFLNCW